MGILHNVSPVAGSPNTQYMLGVGLPAERVDSHLLSEQKSIKGLKMKVDKRRSFRKNKIQDFASR